MKHPNDHFYLITIQYLGFRFHGWQRQPNVKTVQEMIEKTLTYVFEHDKFKILGASRTDAMVSAAGSAFELFVREELDEEWFLQEFNQNLPADIRATSIKALNSSFNVIHDSREKEYMYLFCYGTKFHPFCAPFMTYIREDLDIALMQKGASLFKGVHNFQKFCFQPAPDANFDREIYESDLVENKVYTANFFPAKSYIYRVVGKGFMRHQVRLMVAALFALGYGKISLQELEQSLLGGNNEALAPMAPKSGLILQQIQFDFK